MKKPEEIVNEKKERILEERKANIEKHWETLTIFKDITDIPHLPNPLVDYQIKKLIECGAIPKKDLEDGQTYTGECRNASEAVWHADKQKFTYLRYKWGSSFNEDINHFEDDNFYDLFVPIKIK